MSDDATQAGVAAGAPATQEAAPATANAAPPAPQAQAAQVAAAKRTLPYGKAEKAVEAPASDPANKGEASPKPTQNRALAMAKANAAKLAAENEQLKASAKQIDDYKKALSVHSSAALSSLPKEWQEHIKKLANGDPRRELELVHETAHLRPAQAQAAAPPASTTAATAPKPQADGDADVAVARKYNELKVKAPQAAASMFFANRAAIERGNKKLAAA